MRSLVCCSAIMMNGEETEPSSASGGLLLSLSAKWQYTMDKLSPKVSLRWGIFSVFFFLYLVRVYFAEGWYIVSYGYGIYLLNQLIGFLSPQVTLIKTNNYLICILCYFTFFNKTKIILAMLQLFNFTSVSVRPGGIRWWHEPSNQWRRGI